VKFFSTLLLVIAITSILNAQKIKFFANAAYGVVNYQFQDSNEAFADTKTPGISAFGLQASLQLALSESFRVGTGLNYLKVSGKSSPVFIDSRLINPNATGDYTLDVNSSYLQIPVEFICVLGKDWKVKPLLTGGLSFYMPLKTSYLAQVEPTNTSSTYPKMDIEIDKTTELRGGAIGTGLLIPVMNKEVIFRLNYRLNSLGYQGNTVNEKRALKFNIIEFVVGVSLF
jgi:hypothetical protein